jgi:hypothetical protein
MAKATASKAIKIHHTHGVSLKKAWQIARGTATLPKPKAKRKGK